MKIFYKFLVIGLDFLIRTFWCAIKGFVILINIVEIDRFYVFELLVTDLKNVFNPLQGNLFSKVKCAVCRYNLEQEIKKFCVKGVAI